MTGMFDALEELGTGRAVFLSDPPSGLRGILVIDDLTFGQAAGGIRTRAYASEIEALADAQGLASAMTLKCAIAGLRCGGAKTVVLDHPGLDRPAAFRRLGEYIEDWGGLYRSAGDLGTTLADLTAAAERTSFVNTSGGDLGTATGQTVVNCIRACAEHRGGNTLSGLKVAVQGCGVIGSGVARILAAEGASLLLADAVPEVAEALAAELGGTAVGADEILTANVDIVSPCAIGGVVTAELIGKLRAWAICGGANNQLAEPSVAEDLRRAGLLFVPDYLASSGAVVLGIAGLPGDGDPEALIAGTHETCREVLREAEALGAPTMIVAERIARRRIDAERARRRT